MPHPSDLLFLIMEQSIRKGLATKKKFESHLRTYIHPRVTLLCRLLHNSFLSATQSATRVTRLGELSPKWQWFPWCVFLKIEEIANISGLLITTVEVMRNF
jgi:hypothetical protein